MGNLTIPSIIISLIAFSVIFVGAFMIYGQTVNDYGVSVNKDYTNLSDTINQTLNLSSDIGDKVYSTTTSEDSITAMIKGSYSALRLSMKSFDLVKKVINAIAKELKVPPFMVTAFFACLMIIIAFIVISAVFRLGS